MRPALLLCLLLAADVCAQSLGRVYNRGCEVASRRSGRGGIYCTSSAPSYAFFEFAPASGAGMGSACACTTPTGAKGEAMTFTRASSGTCMKGSETTGIQNGDMVTCATNQPRVMPGGDGSGGLGLSIWEARTNNALRSEEFDNAIWEDWSGGGQAVTRTPNAAIGPDGTLTADQLGFKSTGALQRSALFQTINTTGAVSAGVFLKSVTTAGVLRLAVYTGTIYACTTCAHVPTSWSWCRLENVTSAGGLSTVAFGNLSDVCSGGGAETAQDVYAAGADHQNGLILGPHITTAGTPVTRAEEFADLALTFGAGTTGFSHAATTVTATATPAQLPFPAAVAGVPGDLAPGVGTGSSSYSFAYYQAVFRLDQTPSTPNGYVSAKSSTATVNRWAEFHTGALLNACLNGSCDTGAAASWSPPTWTRVRLGSYTTAHGYLNGVQKLLCLDPDSSRCR